MGRLGAMAMAGTDTSIEVQLSWHLSSNHYPPVPSRMVALCIEAIDAYNAGDYDIEVELPPRVEYRGGQTATVGAVIDGLHLEPWLTREEE